MDAIDISNFDAFQRQKQTNIKLGLLIGGGVFCLFTIGLIIYIWHKSKPTETSTKAATDKTETKDIEQLFKNNSIPYISATINTESRGQPFVQVPSFIPQQNSTIPNGYIRQKGQGFNPNGGQPFTPQ